MNPDLRKPGYIHIEAGLGFYGVHDDADRGFGLTGFVSDANARLITAAPDLIAALKAARVFVEGEAEQRREQIGQSAYSQAPVVLLAQIDAAIAKVEG
jgi:hypothetical protein